MATPTWIALDKHGYQKGDGYVTLDISGGYKGRESRKAYLKITSGEDVEIVQIIQFGKQEYVSFDNDKFNTDASGGSLTITGKTNASSIKFYIDNEDMCIEPESYKIGTNNIDNGADIPNDPGKDSELSFTIVLAITANDGLKGRQCGLRAVTPNGSYADASITQKENESYINLTDSHSEETDVTFTCDAGKSQTIKVNSNDRWDIALDSKKNWFKVVKGADASNVGVMADPHTGRDERTASVRLVTYGNAKAVINIEQAGKAEYTDRSSVYFEDKNGNPVSRIGNAGGLYYIVGLSNKSSIIVAEQTNSITDLNDLSGYAKTDGFIVIDNEGVHEGNMLNTSMTYGSGSAYTFKVPVMFYPNVSTSERMVSFVLGAGDLQFSKTIKQNPSMASAER